MTRPSTSLPTLPQIGIGDSASVNCCPRSAARRLTAAGAFCGAQVVRGTVCDGSDVLLAAVQAGSLLGAPGFRRNGDPHRDEQAMQSSGWLRATGGPFVRTGPGSGTGLMVLCGGWITPAICAGGLLFRSLRRIVVTIPDHDALSQEGAS